MNRILNIYFKDDIFESAAAADKNLQNVTNDTNRPHVGGKANPIKINNLRCNELGRAK